MVFRGICAAVLLFLGMANAQADETFERIKITAGETLYKSSCRRCHSPDSEHPSYGPTLENIVNRKAGSVEGYEYSDALRSSGIVWTEAALRAWMEDNAGFLPGIKMRHVGISDRTVQDFIIAYLRAKK